MPELNETFGNKLKRMRIDHGLSVNKTAKLAGMSAPYISDMERGLKPAPSREKLKDIMAVLGLDRAEREELCDAAGASHHTIAYDLYDYIMETDYVTEAIRLARDMGFGNDFWKNVSEKVMMAD